MTENKKLHIKPNWFTKIIIGLSILSLIILPLVLLNYAVNQDVNTALAYIAYFYNIQITIMVITVITCIYQIVSTKRIINIDKQNHSKIYLYRIIFLIISIIVSLILSAILFQLINTKPISDMNNEKCVATECLGVVVAGAMVFISFLFATFSTLIINLTYLSSCFLADIIYCHKINNTNTSTEDLQAPKEVKMKIEMIPIVNNNNELICYKNRSDFDDTNDICQSASVFVYKKDENGNIMALIAQRSFDKRFAPGKYAEAVGGTVKKYNEYKETAIREVKEEIGITLTQDQLKIGPTQRLNEPSKTIVQWYVVDINQPIEFFKIQVEELERIDWIDINNLEKDLIENPKKYIESMSDIVSIIKPYLI